MWRSLVAHLLWEQGAGGSNPLTPTTSRLAVLDGQRHVHQERRDQLERLLEPVGQPKYSTSSSGGQAQTKVAARKSRRSSETRDCASKK